MYDFAITSDTDKPELYEFLAQAAQALVQGEPDGIANMANIAAVIWQFVPDLNWAGFYRVVDGELVLGPFMGKPACIRIPFGQGVCGTAAQTATTQLVPDVHAFPGHIACDVASRSEIVIPIIRDGSVIAVLDLDSPLPNRFDEADAQGLEQIARIAQSAI